MKNIDYILSGFEDLSLLNEISLDNIINKFNYLKNSNSGIILGFERVDFINFLFDIKLTNLFHTDFVFSNSFYQDENFIKIINILKIIYLQNVILFPLSKREQEMNYRIKLIEFYEDQINIQEQLVISRKDKKAKTEINYLLPPSPPKSYSCNSCVNNFSSGSDNNIELMPSGSMQDIPEAIFEEVPKTVSRNFKSSIVYLILIVFLFFGSILIFDNFYGNKGALIYQVDLQKKSQNNENISKSDLGIKTDKNISENYGNNSIVNNSVIHGSSLDTNNSGFFGIILGYYKLFIDNVSKKENIVLVIAGLVVIFNKFLIDTIVKITNFIYKVFLSFFIFIGKLFLSNIIIGVLFQNYHNKKIVYKSFNYFTLFVNIKKVGNDNFIKILGQLKEIQEKEKENMDLSSKIKNKTKKELKSLTSF